MFKKRDNSIETAKKEAADIYSLCGGDVLKAIEILEKQLSVLQSRVQVLMSLCNRWTYPLCRLFNLLRRIRSNAFI